MNKMGKNYKKRVKGPGFTIFRNQINIIFPYIYSIRLKYTDYTCKSFFYRQQSFILSVSPYLYLHTN